MQGKSTLTSRLKELLDKSVVVPMDGYHYSKHELNNFPNSQEAFRRRGVDWTFNSEKFVHDISHLKETHEGQFPSFDHALGDPIENDIEVSKSHQYVLIEGNYLLLEKGPWRRLKDMFDYTIYIDTDHAILRERVTKRHIQVGHPGDVAVERFETNDLLNAIEIDKSKHRADLVVHSL